MRIVCMAAAGILIGFPALAASGIGEAVAVIQQATAKGDVGARTLQVGAPVFLRDLVQSGPIGEAQLVFQDETRLVVGPNSSLMIDNYLLRNNKTLANVSVNALRGTFRFMSGSSPHEAYSIDTPTATIGVRGTAFDIAVRDEDTSVAVYSGSIELCNLSGRCITVRAGCGVASVGRDGGRPTLSGASEAEKVAFIRDRFPYALAQEGLRSDFRVDVSSCGLYPAPLPQLIEPDAIRLGSPS